MTQELQQTRYDQLLRRVGGMTGPGAKVAEVIAELFPTIDVENLPGELYLLAGTRLATGGVAQIGSAGEVPRVQLFNPAGSNLIITLTSVTIAVAQTSHVRYVLTPNAESTNDLGIRVRDTRRGTLERPTGQVRSASDAAVLAGTGEFSTLGNTLNNLIDPNGICVLAPGTGITFTSTTVASTLRCAFWWRERVAEQAELNF